MIRKNCSTALIVMALFALATSASRLVGVPAEKVPERQAASRVAVVNVGNVFSKYEKVTRFKREFENEIKPIRELEEKLKNELAELKTALEAKDLAEQRRVEINEKMNLGKQKLEKVSQDYKQKISKKTEQQLAALYREVNEAAASCAKTQGFSLVLGYGEPLDGDLFSFVNVTRKMQCLDAGGVCPLYIDERLDLTPDVIELLNRRDRAEFGDVSR